MGFFSQIGRIAYESSNCTAHENSNCCDMKIEEFKMMVKETDRYLFYWNYTSREETYKKENFYHYKFLKFRFYNCDVDKYQYTYYIPDFIDKYNNNKFVKVLTNEMRDFSDYGNDKGPKLISAAEAIDRFHANKYETEEFRLVFWLLFMASVDNDIYNNEFSAIIDMAYCLGFDEAMIRDWCRAVEYVLSGNFLTFGCDLNCETSNGKHIFLGEEPNWEEE